MAGLAVAATGVSLVTIAGAQAAPQRILQNVAVRVAPDGTLTGIRSTVIRSEDGGKPSSSDEGLDPSQVQGGLPVRVLTAYRTSDGRVGTDLRDIKGFDGTVTIEVTVQNTTARPEQIDADVDSERFSSAQLLATPLTVVGGVTLDKDALGTVVTSAGSSDAGSEVTNGVVSRVDDATRVQWSTFLAPPRLSPTATFRLVERTDDFEVPTFDLSVQPGLVTDPSITRLLDVVFGDGEGSVSQLDAETIAQVEEIAASLGAADRTLGTIVGQLEDARDSFGQRAVSGLEAGRTQLSAQLVSLVDQLRAAREASSNAFRTSGAELRSRIDSNIDTILKRLGDPDRVLAQGAPSSAPTSARCTGVPSRATSARLSIFERVYRVSTDLDRLDRAAQGCRADLERQVRGAIGGIVDDLQGMKGQLGRTSADIVSLRSTLSTTIDTALGSGLPAALQDVTKRTTALIDSFTAKDGPLDLLASGGTSSDDQATSVDQALAAVRTQFGTLLGLTSPKGSDLAKALGTLASSVKTQADLLDSGSSSVLADLKARAQQLCALQLAPGDPTQTGPTTDEQLRDQIVGSLSGQDCAKNDVANSLAARIVAVTAALRAAASDAAPGSGSGGSGGSLFDLLGILGDVRGAVDGVLSNQFASLETVVKNALSTGDDNRSAVANAVNGVLTSARGSVYDRSLPAPDIDPASCAPKAPLDQTKAPALNLLQERVAVLGCYQKTLDATVSTSLGAGDASAACPAPATPPASPSATPAPTTAPGSVLGVLGAQCAVLTQDQQGLNDSTDDFASATDEIFDDLSTFLTAQESELTCDIGAAVKRQRLVLGETAPRSSLLERVCGRPRVEGPDVTRTQRYQQRRQVDSAVSSAIGSITDQIRGATGDTDATRRELTRSLIAVLRQIGDPQRPQQGGLLGEIDDQASSTGDAQNVLRTLGVTTVGFRNSRQLEQASLDQLRTVDRRGRDLASAFPLFAMEPPAGSTFRTVFSFRIGNE